MALENSPFEPASDRLYLVPLGGLGEIGKNMMAILYGRDLLVVDAGVMFPKEDMLGVDLVIPDIQFVLQQEEKLKGIFLTHGHEDHIGALPYILPKLKVPVYGTRLTLALVKGKLEEFGLNGKIEFREITPSSRIRLEDTSVEFFPNVHSISDGVGLVVETPLGRVVHSGDFKFDQTPMNGMATDFKKLSTLGESGILALLSDSTYADRPGYSQSERVVGRSLDQVLARAKGRIIIATFASSIPRIQQVLDAAAKHGRRVAFLGKSMMETTRIARQIGSLHVPDNLTVTVEELEGMSHRDLIILTTGSQGEPLAALSLMAAGAHKSVAIEPGDTVVISATPIPGNEGLVFRTINQLFRQGAEVIYSLTTRHDDSDTNLKVHVQGHAGQEELKLFLNLLKPRFFMPVHGEYRHLIHHARLARDVGIPPEHVVIAVDGDIVEVTRDAIRIADRLPVGNVFVHGYGIGEIGRSVIRERRALAEDGVLVVAVAFKEGTHEMLSEPQLHTKGFVSSECVSEVLEKAKRVTVEFFQGLAGKVPGDPEILKGNLKGELNKFFGENMGRKPIIIPVLVWI